MAVDTTEGHVGGVMERMDTRHERRARRRASRGGASASAGIGLVVVGLLFLLQNTGVLVPGLQIWGLLFYVLAVGAATTALARYRTAGNQLTPVVCSGINGALLLAFAGTMFTFNLPWGTLWPLLLIIPGLMGIIGSAATAESMEGAG